MPKWRFPPDCTETFRIAKDAVVSRISMPWAVAALMSHPSMRYGFGAVPSPPITPLAAVKFPSPRIRIGARGDRAVAWTNTSPGWDSTGKARAIARTRQARRYIAASSNNERVAAKNCAFLCRGLRGLDAAAAARSEPVPPYSRRSEMATAPAGACLHTDHLVQPAVFGLRKASDGEARAVHSGFERRGRCFTETDLITTRFGRLGSKGGLVRFSAWTIRAWTAGMSSVSGPYKMMWRVDFPFPFRRCFGSGRFAPCRKKRLIHLGNTAIENTASDVRSVVPNPTAKAL